MRAVTGRAYETEIIKNGKINFPPFNTGTNRLQSNTRYCTPIY
jgi:hypothetical protein